MIAAKKRAWISIKGKYEKKQKILDKLVEQLNRIINNVK